MNEIPTQQRLDNCLDAIGYKLIDDAWDEDGRRTYLHDDEASRDHLNALSQSLMPLGWKRDGRQLRAFRHVGGKELIEVEPGGADTSGHLLHHLKSCSP